MGPGAGNNPSRPPLAGIGFSHGECLRGEPLRSEHIGAGCEIPSISPARQSPLTRPEGKGIVECQGSARRPLQIQVNLIGGTRIGHQLPTGFFPTVDAKYGRTRGTLGTDPDRLIDGDDRIL